MKGIKKSDASAYLDMFKGVAPQAAAEEVVPDKANVVAAGAMAAANAASRATTVVKSKLTDVISRRANVDRILRRFKDKKDDKSKDEGDK